MIVKHLTYYDVSCKYSYSMSNTLTLGYILGPFLVRKIEIKYNLKKKNFNDNEKRKRRERKKTSHESI